ncbi:endonuclease [Litoreibacter roseus]|uniref:Uncharacterized protein n=1 Tax=Litoreibacter roseus TaxID=2601869 RepID=A0A6N6JIM8_9RHOB|nr:endonuclease [Litoreibacter roseus]GFE65797.1 hypothetical protein KIN_28710 [Litoreibacter roseus]
MNQNSGGLTCVIGCWLIAALGGALVAALLMVLAGFSFVAAVALGGMAFVIAGLFLSIVFCKGLPGPNQVEVTSPVEDATRTSPKPVPAGAGEKGVVSSAELALGTSSVPAADVPKADPPKADPPKADPAPEPVEKPAPAAAKNGADARVAAAPASSDIKPSAKLAGEEELAERKGEWKYEGEAVSAKAKAPAKAKPAAEKKSAPKKAPEADSADVGTKPELLSAPRDGGADDLKQIKGVGPQLETMLNDMGIYHFDQVGSWSQDEADWVDANMPKFKGRVARDNWVDQAQKLAAGEETEFSKKVKKGGVYDA